jgi:hypothetical protein
MSSFFKNKEKLKNNQNIENLKNIRKRPNIRNELNQLNVEKEIKNYTLELNELKKAKKLSNKNYNNKLKSFKRLINIEKQLKKKNILKLPQNEYANLIKKTYLENLKKIDNLQVVENKSINKQNSSVLGSTTNASKQNASSVVGNIQKHNKLARVVPEIKNKNIISNLINKLPVQYSKLYTVQGAEKQTQIKNKTNNFKKYVKESIKPDNYINKIIKSYNKNNVLLTKENKKKFIRAYIASKYYTFNNSKNSLKPNF